LLNNNSPPSSENTRSAPSSSSSSAALSTAPSKPVTELTTTATATATATTTTTTAASTEMPVSRSDARAKFIFEALLRGGIGTQEGDLTEAASHVFGLSEEAMKALEKGEV
jgi:hypothetical protein